MRDHADSGARAPSASHDPRSLGAADASALSESKPARARHHRRDPRSTLSEVERRGLARRIVLRDRRERAVWGEAFRRHRARGVAQAVYRADVAVRLHRGDVRGFSVAERQLEMWGGS